MIAYLNPVAGLRNENPYIRAAWYTVLIPLLAVGGVTFMVLAVSAVVSLGGVLISAGLDWLFWSLLSILILYLVVLYFVKTA